jgi:hypothetical protein
MRYTVQALLTNHHDLSSRNKMNACEHVGEDFGDEGRAHRTRV